MAKTYYLTDVTVAKIDEACQRRFWYHELEAGRGVVAKEDLVTEQLLDATQSDLRLMQTLTDDQLLPGSLSAAVMELEAGLTSEEKQDSVALHAFYRRLGWMAAWALYHEPVIRTAFETIPLPPKITLNMDPLQVTIEPGRLLRSRATKELIYRYFQPTPVTNQRWRSSLYYSAVPHLEMRAVSEFTNLHVKTCQPVGMQMGYISQVKEARELNHPYVNAYYNPDNLNWSHNFLIGKDWEEKKVWDFPGGVVAWVEQCGSDVAYAQFAIGPRIDYVNRHVEEWTSRRLHRERQVNSIRQEAITSHYIRNQHFPLNTAACAPLHSETCPYTPLCWDPALIFNPLATGKFVTRPGEPRVGVIEETVRGVVTA